MTFDNTEMNQPMKKECNAEMAEESTIPAEVVYTKDKTAKKENKTSKILAAQARQEKYYKQFDFFFNRSCFRIMTEFYKEKFNKFYNAQMLLLKKEQPDLWRKKQKLGGITAITKVEMDLLVENFIKQTFGAELLDF